MNTHRNIVPFLTALPGTPGRITYEYPHGLVHFEFTVSGVRYLELCKLSELEPIAHADPAS